MSDLDGLLKLIPIGDIAKKLGVSEQQAESAVKQVVRTLLGGMAANAHDDAGTQSLEKALTDHGKKATPRRLTTLTRLTAKRSSRTFSAPRSRMSPPLLPRTTPMKASPATSSRKFCPKSHRSSFRVSAPSFLARSRRPPRLTLKLLRVAELAGSSVDCSAAESAKAPRRLAGARDPQRRPGTRLSNKAREPDVVLRHPAFLRNERLFAQFSADAFSSKSNRGVLGLGCFGLCQRAIHRPKTKRESQ